MPETERESKWGERGKCTYEKVTGQEEREHTQERGKVPERGTVC